MRLPPALLVDVAILAGNDYTRPLFKSSSAAVAKLSEILGFDPGDAAIEDVAGGLRKLLFEDSEKGVATSDGGVWTGKHIESFPAVAAVLASDATLSQAFKYSREVYAHAADTRGPRALLLASLHSFSPIPPALPGAPLQPLRTRMSGCAWTRSIYAARELGILNADALDALETERASDVRLGTERVPFDPLTPSSAIFLRALFAVRAALLVGVPGTTSAGQGRGPLASHVPRLSITSRGVLAGGLAITPTADSALLAPLRDAALLPLSSQPNALNILQSRVPLLTPRARWNIFSRAAALAVVAWEPSWGAPPCALTGAPPLAEANSVASDAKAKGYSGPPAPVEWMRVGWSPDGWTAASAAGEAADAPASASAGGAFELSTRAITLLVAVTAAIAARETAIAATARANTASSTTTWASKATSDFGGASAASTTPQSFKTRAARDGPPRTDVLPTLGEIGALAAVVALSIADCEYAESLGFSVGGAGAVSRAAAALAAPPSRPNIRTASVATWFMRAVSSLKDIASDVRVMSSRFKARPTVVDAAQVDMDLRALLVAAVAGGGSDAEQVSAVETVLAASKNSPTPDLVRPRPVSYFCGPLFHALAEPLGVRGIAGVAPALLSSGSVDAATLLTPSAQAALAAGGERAERLFAGIVCAALDPFDARALISGYAALASPKPVAPPAAPSLSTIALEQSFAALTVDTAKATPLPQTKPPGFIGEGAQEGHTAALPIIAHTEAVCWAIARQTVVIIKGDTGSGKSTKVPQYILDQSLRTSAAARGVVYGGSHTVDVPPDVWGDEPATIFVTQPRRIAAVTLAQRVADERGETVGSTIGFRIGQESTTSQKTRITFCTTGWLLAWLVGTQASSGSGSSGGGASSANHGDDYRSPVIDVADANSPLPDIASTGMGITHLVLDEVHERGIDTDLVILVVKMALTRGIARRVELMRVLTRDAAQAGPVDAARARDIALRSYARRTRLILMSATIDTGVFTDYLAKVASRHAASLEADLRSGRLGVRDLDAACMLTVALPRELAPDASAAACIERSVKAAIASGAGRGGVTSPAEAAAPHQHIIRTLESDRPMTLGVGAKRYNVECIFLDDLYSHPALRNMSRAELPEISSLVQKFDKAASDFSRPRGNGIRPSVGDTMALQDRNADTIFRVAVRAALALAKPGTGDAILIFVPGLADIEAIVDVFSEVAPDLTSAPTARLASGEEVDEDADLAAIKDSQGGADVDVDDSSPDGAPPARSGKGGGGASAPTAAARAPPPIKLLPMHSLINFDDQLAAFEKGGAQTRICIATNIAESSVTIPGVTAVIDLGRTKQIEYDAKLRTSLLRVTWTSKASAAQRQGRAGRVMEGLCIRLYSESFFREVMPNYDLPEMLRLNLETVVLKVKMLGISTDAAIAAAVARGDADPLATPPCGRIVNSAKFVLSQSVQPPDMSSVDAALARLASLGALGAAHDASEVTPFGRLLAAFPSDLSLGRLVAFGAISGCLADAIVMAAVSSVTDIFLFPHPSLANSKEEYSSLITKVARGRWLFGRDASLADSKLDAGGASLHSWSDPILARNAYIAWRGVQPATRRPAWAASVGIMHKRLVAVHSIIKDIAQRVQNDAPHFADVISILIRDSGHASASSGGGFSRGARLPYEVPIAASTSTTPSADATAAAAPTDPAPARSFGDRDWPPPGLFTANTHVLRILLVAAFTPNLCVGVSTLRTSDAGALVAAGLDPMRSLVVNTNALAPDWVTSSALRETTELPAARPGMPTTRVLNGDVARGLVALGVPKTRLESLAVTVPSRIQGRARVDASIGVMVSVDADFDARLIAQGSYSAPSRFGDDGPPSAPGDRWSSEVNEGALPLLGITSARRYVAVPPTAPLGPPAVTSDMLWPAPARDAAKTRFYPSALAFRPLAHALPVSTLALLQMCSTEGLLELPRVAKPPPPGAPPPPSSKLMSDSTRVVVGAVYVSPAVAAARARAPIPASMSGGGGGDKSQRVPILSGVRTVYSSAWRTSSVVSGKRAFASGGVLADNARVGDFDDMDGDAYDDADGRERELIGFSARLPAQSFFKHLASRSTRVSGAPTENERYSIENARRVFMGQSIEDALLNADAGGKKKGPNGAAVVGGTARRALLAAGDFGAGAPGDTNSVEGVDRPERLLAVVPSVSMMKNPQGKVTASLNSPTLLWRDAEAQALSLLLFSRGVEANLTWCGTGVPGSWVVSRIDFDPSGPTPLTLEPLRITLRTLRELTALRAHVSTSLATPRLLAPARAVGRSNPSHTHGGGRGGARSAAPLTPATAAIEGRDFQGRVLLLLGLTEPEALDSAASLRCEAAEYVGGDEDGSTSGRSVVVCVRDFPFDNADDGPIADGFDAAGDDDRAAHVSFSGGVYVATARQAVAASPPSLGDDSQYSSMASLLPPFEAARAPRGTWGCPALSLLPSAGSSFGMGAGAFTPFSIDGGGAFSGGTASGGRARASNPPPIPSLVSGGKGGKAKKADLTGGGARGAAQKAVAEEKPLTKKEKRKAAVEAPRAAAAALGSWKTVARENSQYTLDAPARVRYGFGKRWVERDMPAGVLQVSNKTFGDPAHGKVKVLDVFVPASPLPPVTASVPKAPSAAPTPSSAVSGGGKKATGGSGGGGGGGGAGGGAGGGVALTKAQKKAARIEEEKALAAAKEAMMLQAPTWRAAATAPAPVPPPTEDVSITRATAKKARSAAHRAEAEGIAAKDAYEVAERECRLARQHLDDARKCVPDALPAALSLRDATHVSDAQALVILAQRAAALQAAASAWAVKTRIVNAKAKRDNAAQLFLAEARLTMDVAERANDLAAAVVAQEGLSAFPASATASDSAVAALTAAHKAALEKANAFSGHAKAVSLTKDADAFELDARNLEQKAAAFARTSEFLKGLYSAAPKGAPLEAHIESLRSQCFAADIELSALLKEAGW